MPKQLILILLTMLLQHLSAQTVDSIAVARQVDSLIQLSRTLTDQGDMDRANAVNDEAMKLVVEQVGKETTLYANVAFNTGRIQMKRRAFQEAETWYRESMAIRVRISGKENLDYVKVATNLANVLRDTRQFDKAEPLYIEADSLAILLVGKNHPVRTILLESQALLYEQMDRIRDAENKYLDALAIWKILEKEDSKECINLQNNLSSLYIKIGQFSKAEPMLLHALEAVESKTGSGTKESLSIRFSLALLYYRSGQYELALRTYEGILNPYKQAWGGQSVWYASLLANLALVNSQMGNYQKAEEWFAEAVSVFECKEENRKHTNYQICLNNMANMYRDLGQYSKAETVYGKVIAAEEKLVGKRHPRYASTLNDLAILCRITGRMERAEKLYQEYLEIIAASMGKENSEYSKGLNNLANLYVASGAYDKAEPLHLEAMRIRERVFGKQHLDYANSLVNLASLYHRPGQYSKSEAMYKEGMDIQKKVLGPEHPETVVTLKNLAFLCTTSHQFEKAEQYFNELSRLDRNLMRKAVRHLSEKELGNYTKLFTDNHDKMLSFLQVSGRSGLVPAAYDNTLFYKGFLLQSRNGIRRLAGNDSLSMWKVGQLKELESRLAAQYVKPVAERDSVALVQMEFQANELDKDLARTVAGYGEAMRQVNWKDVQAELKPGEASVEFVHYRYEDKISADNVMYAALVLRPGMEVPAFITLFEQRSLDSLFSAQGERKADYVNHLYTLAERGAIVVDRPSRTLYELIWRPLEQTLGGAATVYYSPTGLLHKLNLGAIPVNAEETLADRYRLFEVNSTRQLVIPSANQFKNDDAVLFGGLRYDADTTAFSSTAPALASRWRGAVLFQNTDSTLRGGSWDYLAGTEKEMKSIQQILSGSGVHAVTLSGYGGTEESFKELGEKNNSPRILHIATHGFFFPDVKGRERSESVADEEPVFKTTDNPMLRSGLILSGGNAGWKGEGTLEGREDGVLTAYEISQMDLSNTELVVLSACETGLGDIQGNEGVYGLQRAFKIAGAKYLIMSLWQVPDRQTSMLMTTFYRKWLEDKLNIPEAFHAAQKQLRDNGLDPYNWAGFVLVE